ncbi:MAG: hypothetical protein P8M08_07390 [Akkermansiaceae bacterium]|nr:hypothetical protein [Akkermansiaceae bacterium]
MNNLPNAIDSCHRLVREADFYLRRTSFLSLTFELSDPSINPASRREHLTPGKLSANLLIACLP